MTSSDHDTITQSQTLDATTCNSGADNEPNWDELLAEALADDGPMTAERICKWAPLFDDEFWDIIWEQREWDSGGRKKRPSWALKK